LSDGTAPGRLLARGRDCDIFEHGPHRVLRRSRRNESLASEVDTMRFVRERGYPVPEVYDMLDDGCAMVMERVDGPTLAEAVQRRPWTLRSSGRLLARLHQQLHAITAPDWLRPFGDGGTAVVHRDLHPLNVLMTRAGPVVIDWTNAVAARPEIDIVDAWLVMSAGGIEGASRFTRVLLHARKFFVDAFIGEFDRGALLPFLRPAAENRSDDSNLSAGELAAIWRLVAREERRPTARG
jgi:aminoglycoside phosphotransferase (APT) family kinase protein